MGLDDEREDEGYSGRKVIGYGLLGIVAVLALVFAIFWQYRAAYLQVADYAVREVVPLVDRLTALTPEDVEPSTWQTAVAETQAMVRRALLLGLVSRAELETLRARWSARCDAADATTARSVLALFWVEMEAGAQPRLSKHPIPQLLQDLVFVPMTLQPLGPRVPPGVDPVTWRDALATTRRAWIASHQYLCWDEAARRALEQRWWDQAARARPDTAIATLNGFWDELVIVTGIVEPPEDEAAQPTASEGPLAFPRRPAVLQPQFVRKSLNP